MRSLIRATGVLVLALAPVACDTTQPLQVDTETYTLQLNAVGAQMRMFNVWDMYLDNNQDGVAEDVNGDNIVDANDLFLFCKTRVQAPLTSSPTSIPYNYTLEITILRAGETVPERVTSEDAASDPTFNRTGYDQAAQSGLIPSQADIVEGTNRWRFRNARVMTEADQIVMMSLSNPLATANPAMYGAVGSGRCSTQYPGDPYVDASALPSPIPITLHKGDTVTVRARIGSSAPGGVTVMNPPAPGIAASFTRNGRAVTVRGATSSSLGPEEGFTFTFTPR